MQMNILFTAMLAIFGTAVAFADTITVKETKHVDVIVREGESRYFVATPQNGKAFSISKSEVDPKTITLSKEEERKALQSLWEKNAGYNDRSPVILKSERKQESAAPKTAPVRITAPPDPAYADGTSGYAAPPAVPRDSVQASSRIPRRQSMVIVGGSDTMPKIVVSNPGGPGGGVGGGGMGGGTGRGVVFGNISQLFGTIDDRTVGEPPATIGSSVSVAGSSSRD